MARASKSVSSSSRVCVIPEEAAARCTSQLLASHSGPGDKAGGRAGQASGQTPGSASADPSWGLGLGQAVTQDTITVLASRRGSGHA